MNNRLFKSIVIFLVSIVIVTICVEGYSANLTASVKDAGLIISPTLSRETRGLVKFDLPSVPEGSTIDFVSLHLKLQGNPLQGDYLDFIAFPVTTHWSLANLSWSSPWTKSGGDFIDTLVTMGGISFSQGDEIYLDITDFYKLWSSGTLENKGIILLPFTNRTYNFGIVKDPKLPLDIIAEVIVFYTGPEVKK